ncbi:stage II sporulation protein M [Intestinibacter sp.]
MRKKDFYKRNKSLIIISIIFIVFVVGGSYLNKIDSSNLNKMSSQIDEIRAYYNGNINIKDFVFTNIKEYIRYLGLIGILSLFFFTYPIAIIVFIVKAMSIGYTINTSVILLGLNSFKMCIIVFLKNIIIVPMSIILIELSIGYIKSVYKQLKNKRQDSIVSLGKEFVLNLIIVMCASIILQSILNIISISIIQFLAR